MTAETVAVAKIIGAWAYALSPFIVGLLLWAWRRWGRVVAVEPDAGEYSNTEE